MKYEVIGWTYCGDQEYPQHECNTASVEAAIAREIREHDYCFGGDRHEDYCPVLNDGTYVSFSWRGWGGVMARARGASSDDRMAYALYYMDTLIEPKALKYPEHLGVEEYRIVPKDSLSEIFKMHLTGYMFQAVNAGTKTVEARLFDEKRKLVDIGDYIEFINADDESQSVLRRVTGIEIDESFVDLFSHWAVDGNGKWKECARYSPEALGSPAGSGVKAMAKAMRKYYTAAQEKKYGVIVFNLEQPAHRLNVCLEVWTDTARCYEMQAERLKDHELTDEAREEFLRKSCDGDYAEDALGEIADGFLRHGSRFWYGKNDVYNADVNVMIRETLKGLAGKEAALKDMSQNLCAYLSLEIYAVIVKSSRKEPPRLSVDDDIAEFLQKSGIKLNIESREI